MSGTEQTAVAEASVPEATVLRLGQAGTADIPRLAHLCRGGDWSARAMAASAVGVLIRRFGHPPGLSRAHAFWARVPYLRRHLAGVGPRGVLVRGLAINALQDRVWFVRTAAALALGECRHPEVAEFLRPLLSDPYRPVRLAAAAALHANQVDPGLAEAVLLAECETAPAYIGDTASVLEWLTVLSRDHADVLAHLPIPATGRPADARGWARHLAGEMTTNPVDVREAEIQRYVQGKERHYNLTKPFTVGSHQENIWLLHSFLVVAENLLAPRHGMVLDLGGGAGWVSELLAKLGYKPVTLDISAPLISVGRERFQREGLQPRFVAGDMTTLPFAAKTFEAVVVIDALHHVPDVPAVFREAHRVLVDGGQFLLAEPAEGHAESAISRRERRDHGICEREIHLFEAARYGEAAGFDTCSVIPHLIPALSISPADLRQAMSRPSEQWNIQYGGRRAAFDEYFLQGILCHPILAFGKGRRVLDSRLPGRLQALIEPSLVRKGQQVTGTVRVTNRGDTRWLGGSGTGCVRLGLQLFTPDRHLLDLDFARAVLPEDLPAGRTADVAVELTLPLGADSYLLKLDMVCEHICWFEDRGSPVVYLAV